VYLGDPDFVRVPVGLLTEPAYAAGLRAGISPGRASSSADLPGLADQAPGADHTSHLSVLDRDGNRVAATLTVNGPFGSGFVAPGTGVVLNNQMDDFSAKPGVPNAYGLVGGEANAIAPGKRPLSSMSPTFADSAMGAAALGTPGGSRIISVTLLALLELAEGRGPQAWVSLPRFHHQYLPDQVEFEAGALSTEEVEALEAMGHVLRPVDQPYGNMQALFWDRAAGRVLAASDPRGGGLAVVR
jgi:gamma-glutamyltranspeptidase/glutathione hydrolase